MRERLFRTYGTTLRGLEMFYPVDKQDYLAFVHDVPVCHYLKPDPAQRKVLATLPIRKVILTNADAAHARRVLTALELENCFDGIVDVNSVHPYCKPQPEALKIAMAYAGEGDPHHCVLIDDLRHTTRAARAFGFYSILYGDGTPGQDADAAFTNWSCLPGLVGL